VGEYREDQPNGQVIYEK